MSLVHGMYQWWCELCTVNAQLAFAEKINAGVPELLRRKGELEAGPPDRE